MKAIVLEQTGGVENLKIKNLPIPEISSNEVLIQVKAISINPVDAFVRSNEQSHGIFLLKKDNEPVILGWDVSGTITQVGREVEGLNIRDDVFGMVNFPGQGKTYAEYVAAPANQLTLKPENISHEEAAGATLAALTAFQAIVVHGKVKAGEKVLIHAAAGGVGHYAVQIAKSLGAHVIGTSSAANKDFVLSLGADEHIDYTTQAFEDVVHDNDLVIDSQWGDAHLLRSLKTLKKGGRLITLLTFLNESTESAVKAKEVHFHRIGVESNGDHMKAIADLMSEGLLKSHVSATYNFDEMAKAHSQIETGKTVGKVVVKV